MQALQAGLGALKITGPADEVGGNLSPPLPSPLSPGSNPATLIVGTLNFSMRIRYGFTSRHVPMYLFTPYSPEFPSFRVACSAQEKDNHVALIEPYPAAQEAEPEESAPAAGGGGGGDGGGVAPAAAAAAAPSSIVLPRGTLVRLLGKSGDSEAELQALTWQAVPFPNYPDPAKPQGAWLAAELMEVARRQEAALADPSRATLDWPATFNLDNATTLDVDDVVSVRRSASGVGWDFAVTIADVACVVPPGSPLDIRARENAQTLYSLEGKALRPMLPFDLSHGACSLNAGTRRPGLALLFHWDGSVTPGGTGVTLASHCGGAFVSVVVVNRHSFAYETVVAAGAAAAAGVGEEVSALAAVAGELGKALCIADRDLSADPHTWIEAVMLYYNAQAGKRVRELQGGLFRKHTAALQARLSEYASVDASLSHLAFSAALYVPSSDASPSHWGLNLGFYSYASSPIRRYADLYTQRVLKWSSSSAPAGEEEVVLAAWLNQRSRCFKRYERDAFFLGKIDSSALITVRATFLRLCSEEALAAGEEGGESPEEEDGGGGRQPAPGGGAAGAGALALPSASTAGAGAGAPQPLGGGSGKGRAQRRAEFWVSAWKRVVRLRLTVVEEAPGKVYTILSKDETLRYVLKPGSPVTLKAFANLRGKNWKKSMVFQVSPAEGGE